MKTFWLYALVVTMIVGLGAGTALSGKNPAKEPMPAPNAEAVWKYMTKEHPYTSWDLWPGKGKLYKGTEPHGALLTTYVNKAAFKSASKKTGMADGSLVVKENYMPDKKLAAITIMYKIKEYNPAGGDWFWAKYLPDGKIEASGKVDMCIGCHGTKKGNDYIMTGPVKK